MMTKRSPSAGLIALTACALVQGCVADTAEDREPDEALEETVSAELDSSGRYCGGFCYTGLQWDGAASCHGSELRWYTFLPNVTQDCRARIVQYCHNRNWRFGDAYWTTNPPDGYRCVRPT